MPATRGKLSRMLGLGGRSKPGINMWERIRRRLSRNTTPTVFHITHHKAGSQWIHRILLPLANDRIVAPEVDNAQFLTRPIQPGKVYPTVYVTREQFDSVQVPPGSRRFVIIRDLRDTLISVYFSVKHSHPILHERLQHRRNMLHEMTQEEGLMHIIHQQLAGIAQFQWSWLNAGEELIKYEDLLKDDEAILARVLMRQCRLEDNPERFREIILANRFEARAGRKPGQEDVHSHERKGIAGDWKNYFTPKITSTFKRYYGSVLIATGYERDFNW